MVDLVVCVFVDECVVMMGRGLSMIRKGFIKEKI